MHDFEIKNVSIKEVNHGGAKPSWGLNTFSYFESDGGARSRKKETIDARPASRMVEKSKQRRKRKQILLKFPQMFVKDPLPQAWSQIETVFTPRGAGQLPEPPRAPRRRLGNSNRNIMNSGTSVTPHLMKYVQTASTPGLPRHEPWRRHRPRHWGAVTRHCSPGNLTRQPLF